MVSTTSTTKPKVLLIGSNPSIKTQSDFAFFKDTKSGKTIDEWIEGIDANFFYGNVSTIKTENNRPLTKAEIKISLPNLLQRIQKEGPNKIIAFGKTAHEALTLLHVPHLEMPHPSGLSRKNNDKNYIKQKIKELADYIKLPN